MAQPITRSIETASDLRRAWGAIRDQLRRDLSAARGLATDPLGTLQALGWEVGPEAAEVLVRASTVG